MRANVKPLDRGTGLLIGPRRPRPVADDDPVHFILEAVRSVLLWVFQVNRRGSGRARYPPRPRDTPGIQLWRVSGGISARWW